MKQSHNSQQWESDWEERSHKILPNILKACSAFTAFGAISLNTDIISRKSSKVQSPSLLELKTLHIRSLNGFTRSSGYWSILVIGSFAFLLWPTFSGARALNFWWALEISINLITAAETYLCLVNKKVLVSSIIVFLYKILVFFSSEADWSQHFDNRIGRWWSSTLFTNLHEDY